MIDWAADINSCSLCFILEIDIIPLLPGSELILTRNKHYTGFILLYRLN